MTSWLSFVVSTVSLSLSHGMLGQVWYLIVSIPDRCTLTYFKSAYASALSDQSRHCPHEKAWIKSYPLSAQRRLCTTHTHFVGFVESRVKSGIFG